MNKQKKQNAQIYAWLNGKSFYTYVLCNSRWSINFSLSNFSMCRQHSIIYCHMSCLFFSSALIDQTLSLPSSSTRQEYIDNDQLDNLFLLTSCQSYCCCYLFVFPCIISSSSFFFCYFHLIFCYISNHPCQQDFCFCWPFQSIEFDIILFDQWHFFHQFCLSSLDSYMKIYIIKHHRHFSYEHIILVCNNKRKRNLIHLYIYIFYYKYYWLIFVFMITWLITTSQWSMRSSWRKIEDRTIKNKRKEKKEIYSNTLKNI